MERKSGRTIRLEALVEAGGEHTGLEAPGAEHGLLAEGHLLEGEPFLGIDGPVDANEVGAEAGDCVDVFQPDDDEVGGGETMFAGVLGRAGTTPSGLSGPIDLAALARLGGELVLGDGFLLGAGLVFG
jgi:hypothetical protein